MYNHKLKILFAALGLSLVFGVPAETQAAFNDVVFSADTTVNLSGPDYDLTILTGGEVEAYTVGTTTLSFDLENGSAVTIRSADRLDLVNDGDIEVGCTDSYSELVIESTSSQTIVITPTGVCTVPPSSSSSSGSHSNNSNNTPTIPVPPGEAHPLGTNIKDSSGTVFTITSENGSTVRRPYTSWGAFISYGFNSVSSIVDANTGDLALSVGSFIPPQDGSIICSDRDPDRGTCYLITQGQKAGFVSAGVFTGQGFSFANVYQGDVSFLTSTNLISSSTARHLPGTLVNNNGTYQIVGTNGLLGFPSSDIFTSWGYDFAKAAPANAQDTALTQTGVVTIRQAGQVRLYYQ